MNEDWSSSISWHSTDDWSTAHYTGPVDGVIGPKTVEALQRMGVAANSMSDATAQIVEQLQKLAAATSTMSDQLYGMILDAEDDGKDHPFPESPDPEYSDAAYYWHRMLEDAKKEAEETS